MSEGSDTVDDPEICWICKTEDIERHCPDCGRGVCDSDDCTVMCGCGYCEMNERWTCKECAPDMANCHVCGMEDLACWDCDPTKPKPLDSHDFNPCCCYHTHIEENHPDAYAGGGAASQINMEHLVL